MSNEANQLIHSIRTSIFRNIHGEIPVKVKVRKGVKIKDAMWAKGEHNAGYFYEKGEPLQSQKGHFDKSGNCFGFVMDIKGEFFVDSPGTYTVYVKSTDGSEAVSNVTVRPTLPFLLAPMFAALILMGTLVAISIATSGKPDKHIVATVSKPVVVSSTSSAPVRKKSAGEKLMVTDNITSAAAFTSGKSGTVGSWSIENAKSNTVIIQAQLVINGKVIATSLSLKPRQKVQSIQLSSDVPKGSYKGFAYISYYNIKTQEYISRAGYHVGITVA